MLICNNCGHANRDDTLICVNCRMQSGFTKKTEKSEQESVMCINCGNHFMSELSRCPTCRFPMNNKSKMQQPVQDAHPIRFHNLKMG